MARYIIHEITDWEKDEAAVAGDMSHAPASEVMMLYTEEYQRKVENGEWQGLPFECKADDEDEALEKYAAKHCRYDYIQPIGADIELITA